MSSHPPSTLIFLSIVYLGGCSESQSKSEKTTLKYNTQVEIAPDKWVVVDGQFEVYTDEMVSGTDTPKNPHEPAQALKQIARPSRPNRVHRRDLDYECALYWNAKKLTWRGKEMPVSLREYDGGLYMIGVNGQDLLHKRLVFYKLNVGGTGFEEIKPSEYPPCIAIHNMAMGYERSTRHYKIGDHTVDYLQMLRTLDIHSPGFADCLTAKMWYQIETGTEYDKISSSRLNRQFLEDYVAKHRPIALPTIVKEPR